MQSTVPLSTLLHELWVGIRSISRWPFTSSIAILMLALGLGFNTALFAVVEAVLLRPLPYAEADRVVLLWTGRSPDGARGVNSYPDFLDWRDTSRSFESLAAYNISFGTLTGRGDPEELHGSAVSPDFFKVLRIPLLHGQGLQPGDEHVGAAAGRPIVLSHRLWVRRFGSDPAVVGKTIMFAEYPRRVVGVVAPEFQHPEPFWDSEAEYWTPMTETPEMLGERGARYLRVIGRLGRGITLEAARREMDDIGRRLMRDHPVTNSRSVVVEPIRDELVGDARTFVLVFLSATIIVLFLVIANVVSLLLARLSYRRTELAVRAALGARRTRLVGLVVAESVVLGLAGGIAGLAIAQAGLRLILAYGPDHVFSLQDAALNWRVLLFALAVALTTGLTCGLITALRLGGPGTWSRLGNTRNTSGVDVPARRAWLVGVEVALAVPLLFAAVLLVRTLVGLQGINPGFDASHAVQFRVNLPAASYDVPDRRREFFRAFLDRLRAIPGITAAGATSSVPLGGLNNTGGAIVYERLDGSLAEVGVATRAVTGGYFAALAVPLRQGRALTDEAADTAAVVVNESAARRLWPGENPIGRRLRYGTLSQPGTAEWLTVIGVTGDVRHVALSRPADAEMFESYTANPWSTMTVVVRSERLDDLRGSILTTLRELNPSLPLRDFALVQDIIDRQLKRPRFGAFSAMVLGGLGIVLAAAGTFAVLWLLVTQRLREIGIRMALGASPGAVARLVLQQSMRPAIFGVLMGALAAIWLGRGLEAMLFEVTARDPRTIGIAASGMLVVALLASWLPVRRAMRTDPVRALRET